MNFVIFNLVSYLLCLFLIPVVIPLSIDGQRKINNALSQWKRHSNWNFPAVIGRHILFFRMFYDRENSFSHEAKMTTVRQIYLTIEMN